MPLRDESELEKALQSYLRAQVAEFGSVLVDEATLRTVAYGSGLYACMTAEEAAYWIAEDYGWKVEQVDREARQDAGLLPLWRMYDLAHQATPETIVGTILSHSYFYRST